MEGRDGAHTSASRSRWATVTITSLSSVLLVFAGLEITVRLAMDRLRDHERFFYLPDVPFCPQYLSIITQAAQAHQPLGRVMEDLDAYRPHRFLWWVLKPHLDLLVSNYFDPPEVRQQTRWRLVTNSRGFPGSEHIIPKPQGTVRIVALGDSSAFGWGVNAGEAYPEKLQHLLNNQSHTKLYDIVNLGVPGYSTVQGLYLLQTEVFQYEPNIIVVSYGVNDAWLTLPRQTDEDRTRRARNWRGIVEDLLDHTACYQYLKGRQHARRVQELLTDPHALDQSGWIPRVSVTSYEQNLREVARIAQAHDSRVMFFTLCVESHHPYLEAIKRVAADFSIPLIEGDFLLQETQSTASEEYGVHASDLRLRDGCHPSAFGHRLIAQRLAQVVREIQEHTAEVSLTRGKQSGASAQLTRP